MATRVHDMGIDRMISGKIAAKYDNGVESRIRQWVLQVEGSDIGEGRDNVKRNLMDGQILCRFMQCLMYGSSRLPPACQGLKIQYNTNTTIAFKQMENIEKFMKACHAYGVPVEDLFQVVDLYEGRNMANVLCLFLKLGTEAQRNGFNGPTIGPRPTERHIVRFTREQMNAGQGIIGLQAGTNQCASQKGMKMGASRHIADMKIEPMSRDGEGVIGLQAGTNRFASQKGMNMGSTRHIADIKVGQMSREGETVIGLQAGSNRFASQKGMTMGTQRHIADINIERASKEGEAVIGLQMGTNTCATQAGMMMGAQRHIADLRVDDASREGKSVIGLQMGSNLGASQAGMTMGTQRHIADLYVGNPSREGEGVIGLQMGSNQGASQAGMHQMGHIRHVIE